MTMNDGKRARPPTSLMVAKRQGTTAIVVAAIAGLASLAVAIVNVLGPAWTDDPTAEPTAPTPTSSSSASPVATHYDASFAGSTIDGEIAWSEGRVDIVGVLTLRGAHARSSCSVKVTLEAIDANGDRVTGDERRCDNTSGWPELSLIHFDDARVARIDLLVFVDRKADVRIVCPRGYSCHLESP
jgi:hypothetical protein